MDSLPTELSGKQSILTESKSLVFWGLEWDREIDYKRGKIFFFRFLKKCTSFFRFFFFLAAQGLCCFCMGFLQLQWMGALFHCSAQSSHCCGSCFRAQALGTWASVAAACRLSSCGTWAELLHGMWNLAAPGIEPVSPTLATWFLSTAPPGKSQEILQGDRNDLYLDMAVTGYLYLSKVMEFNMCGFYYK